MSSERVSWILQIVLVSKVQGRDNQRYSLVYGSTAASAADASFNRFGDCKTNVSKRKQPPSARHTFCDVPVEGVDDDGDSGGGHLGF